MSDRIAVMRARHDQRRLSRAEATQERVLALALGAARALTPRRRPLNARRRHRDRSSRWRSRSSRWRLRARRSRRRATSRAGNLLDLLLANAAGAHRRHRRDAGDPDRRDRHLGRVGVCDLRRGRRASSPRRACRCRRRGAAASCSGGACSAPSTARSSPTPRIPSIVVTLATMVALRDGLRWITQGAWVQDLPAGFPVARVRPVVVSVRVAAGIAAVAPRGVRVGPAPSGGRARRVRHRIERRCRAARRPRHVARSNVSVFTIAGALTGLAALLNAVRFNQIPSNAGLGLEMQVIAAVVVGGTAITGGGARRRARCSASCCSARSARR